MGNDALNSIEQRRLEFGACLAQTSFGRRRARTKLQTTDPVSTTQADAVRTHTSTGKAPRKRKRSTARRPRPKKKFPLGLAAACVLGVGVFSGVALSVGLSSPAVDDVAQLDPDGVSQPDSTPTPAKASANAAASPSAKAAKERKKVRSQTDMTLRMARKLRDAGKSRAALEILDEYSRSLETVPTRIRDFQEELLSAVDAAKPAVATPKAKPAMAAAQDDEDDYDYDADDDDDDENVAWPDEALDATAVALVRPRVTPTPRKTRAVVAEEEFEEEEEEDSFGVGRASPVAEALQDLISVPHTLRGEAELGVSYALKNPEELEDFEALGFDKFDVVTAHRGNGAYSEPVVGLECGVSSQRLARMWHSVSLSDRFEIEMRLWVNAGTSSSKVVFLLGKKIGVSWGQQIVKVNKRGNTKPLAGRVDQKAFGGERFVRVKISVEDNVLTVRCNGRETARKAFKPGQLKGKFGLLAKGVRLQLTELKINGTVDVSTF